ncbi:hypothetical protein BV25DRAFT_1826321 [Artomyces pyxidatus]|uniref:Uncharacterized protein n=1 Tax=Artomyces pyxidatus TaxID=48021 RepID=A0ACB8SZL3_9AGAM|nr:hypothetical protein BV25DRAFT_1826321 [Artomyces pyxidatus]
MVAQAFAQTALHTPLNPELFAWNLAPVTALLPFYTQICLRFLTCSRRSMPRLR